MDLVPFKTCSYDCVYCQLGHTTCHTVERKERVPLDAVLDDLKLKLASRPDYVGDPLNPRPRRKPGSRFGNGDRAPCLSWPRV